MSGLRYYAYPGMGTWAREHLGYSQAVRVENRIECSGQGGWLQGEEGIQFPTNLKDEIAQAFANVDLNLKDAGGKGWSQVYRLYSFHTSLTPEVNAIMKENFDKWMPEHKPIWTEIGVKELGAPNMNVELEVVALDVEGAEKAREGR